MYKHNENILHHIKLTVPLIYYSFVQNKTGP